MAKGERLQLGPQKKDSSDVESEIRYGLGGFQAVRLSTPRVIDPAIALQEVGKIAEVSQLDDTKWKVWAVTKMERPDDVKRRVLSQPEKQASWGNVEMIVRQDACYVRVEHNIDSTTVYTLVGFDIEASGIIESFFRHFDPDMQHESIDAFLKGNRQLRMQTSASHNPRARKETDKELMYGEKPTIEDFYRKNAGMIVTHLGFAVDVDAPPLRAHGLGVSPHGKYIDMLIDSAIPLNPDTEKTIVNGIFKLVDKVYSGETIHSAEPVKDIQGPHKKS